MDIMTLNIIKLYEVSLYMEKRMLKSQASVVLHRLYCKYKRDYTLQYTEANDFPFPDRK